MPAEEDPQAEETQAGLQARLLDAARRYALALRGIPPRTVTLDLWDGARLPFDVPAVPIRLPRENGHGPKGPAAGAPPGAEGGGAGGPSHDEAFRQVSWPGLGAFRFGARQGRAVAALWAAWEAGEPEVGERELLAAAQSDGGRLRDLFRNHPAWKTLIVRGVTQGTYRLAGAAAAPPAPPAARGTAPPEGG